MVNNEMDKATTVASVVIDDFIFVSVLAAAERCGLKSYYQEGELFCE